MLRSASPERRLSAKSAVKSGLEICGSLSLEPRFKFVGDAIRTCVCDLVDAENRITTGKGKGIGIQAQASALFEALEHYFYLREELSAGPSIPLRLGREDEFLRSGSPDFELILGEDRPSFTRLRYRDLTDSGREVWIPAFLTSPTFASRNSGEAEAINQFGLLRYSTNSGTASGLSAAEAVLHGLLECVERDSLGVELIKTIISKEPAPVRQVNLDSLPLTLSELRQVAERETGLNLQVWCITNDLNIPSFLAGLGDASGGRQYFGSGASLSSAYAAERAVLEAVQSYHNYTLLESPRPLFGQAFDPSSLYQKCFLEAGYFLFKGGAVLDRSLEFKEDKALGDLDQQVETAVERLSAKGHTPYFRLICGGRLTVVQVAIPSLERFHLVSLGIPVAPGVRGRTFLACNQRENDLPRAGL